MPKQAFFPKMTFDERNFNNHESMSTPHKNKSNHSSTHCYSSSQLEDANLYEDWGAHDQEVCKGEEFEDESEMEYGSVAGCKFNNKLLSVNKMEYSGEKQNYKGNVMSALAWKFQSPNKEMRRLSLGRIPNHVKCFSCERYIKESHFAEHLLFGEVRCVRCGSLFSDCQRFMVWVAQCAMGAIKVCNHRFVFTNDPLTYIAGKLSVGGADHSLVDEELLNEMERYIYKIRSLESRHPWQHAMSKCKEHLALEKSKKIKANNDRVHHSEHLITKNEYKSIEDLSTFTDTQSVFLTKTFQDDEQMLDSGHNRSSALNQPSTCYKDKECFVNSQELSYITSTEMASSAAPQGKYNKVTNHPLLDNTQFSSIHVINKGTVPCDTQRMKTGHITDKCGTVTTPARSTTANSHLKKKKIFKKQKKKSMPFSRKKVSKTNVSLNIVAQPSDGFYYITKRPIEECPNCYCILCPSACTVNCRTFLITFICPDCNLLIYIANDDTCIITEKKHESSKKRLPGKSKKHVSNPKAFHKLYTPTTNPFILT